MSAVGEEFAAGGGSAPISLAASVIVRRGAGFVALSRLDRASTSLAIDTNETCRGIVLPFGNTAVADRNSGDFSWRGVKNLISHGQWSFGTLRRRSRLSTISWMELPAGRTLRSPR